MRLRVLLVEPYHEGSHAAFVDTLTGGLDLTWTLCTLPGRHWKWRMRGSALHFADTIPVGPYDVLFATSYLALAELQALRPDLARLPSLLYFHENQLAYPSQGEAKERDHHFGFTQLVSGLAASACAFNSEYNRRSFLEQGRELLRRMPDARNLEWVQRIEARSQVLPVPIPAPPEPAVAPRFECAEPILLWNHRWEHDKNPESWFAALETLVRRDVPFRAIVCGRRYDNAPAVFDEVPAAVTSRLLHFGPAPTQAEYEALLASADVVVSTARQEFQGLSVLEAVARGARPFVPARLSYPEIFPAAYQYGDDDALAAGLESLCRDAIRGRVLRKSRPELTAAYRADQVLPRFERWIRSTTTATR